MFPHSVGNEIRSRIQKDAAAYLILPIIIMGKTTKARLDPSQYDRGMLICLTDQITVDYCRHVRTKAHLSSRRVGILLAVLSGYGIMVHHRIHISGTDQETKARRAKYLYTLFLTPVGLWNDPHTITSAFQKS